MASSGQQHYPFCPDEHKYQKITKIGQGTFGEVFKARNKTTNEEVAMKRVLMANETEGFPVTALREIKILQSLKHDNIVNLLEIAREQSNASSKTKSSVYLVFEFCEHDLAGLLGNHAIKFNLSEVKSVMQQLLNGLYFIHGNNLLHRDIKTANVLITKTGKLKLADFGLSRSISESASRYTTKVVTLWYRPPELLLGEKHYGPAVDLWGAGCLMAEMWTRTPVMPGHTEQKQLTLISEMCGSITSSVWPNVANLELFDKLHLPQGERRKIKDRMRTHVSDPLALALLDNLLTLDPSRRINANDALDHDFFWTEPMPGDLGKVMSRINRSMFQYLTPKRTPLQPVDQMHAVGAKRPKLCNPTQDFEPIF